MAALKDILGVLLCLLPIFGFVAYFGVATAGAEWDAGEAETAVNEDGAAGSPA